MGTIELDTSNPAPFENFVSQNDRDMQKILFYILVGFIVLYIAYDVIEAYKSKNKANIEKYKRAA